MRKGEVGWFSTLSVLVLVAFPVAASAGPDPQTPEASSRYPRFLCIELSIASLYVEATPLWSSAGGDEKRRPITAEELERTKQVLRARVMGCGLPEPSISTDEQTWMRIGVSVDRPRLEALEDLKELLTSCGFFWVYLLHKAYAWEDRGPSITEQDALRWFTFFDTQGQESSGSMAISHSEVIASWQDLKPNSRVVSEPGQPAAVTFELEEPVRSGFEKLTGSNIGRYLVFVLDDRFLACPRITAAIPGKGVIPLVLQREDALGRAKRVSIMLNSGPLPLEVKWVKSWWAEDT